MLLEYRYFNTQETAEGKLALDICAINKGRPVTNATVKVYTREDGRRGAQLDELVANRVGRTAEVRLGCPPKIYSQESSDTKPYSEYELEVVAEGFVTTIIQGVQIFSGQTALQEVMLKPIGEHTGKSEVILVKENTLRGNLPPAIPEEQVKPEPSPTGLFVLDEPVVPEYIVVHDGDPRAGDAPNYYIKYKDYIKNVASGMIYPTWPAATLSANILAIISFTLNRVFTEWYRHMGKNFTVTSQAAFDNAFSYGRNVYTVVSDITDELFVNYIGRKGIRQPLLTRFCDEAKWESKRMGDSGSTELEILRRFFGQDIFLNTVAKVTGVPFSYPGYRLQSGSTGEEVRILQMQLNVISGSYSTIPKIQLDGVYSEKTRQAVCAFQQTFRAPVSGVVDFSVWHKISDVYVSVKRMAEMV